MSATSLLPDNRTTLETALEKTLASHLAQIDSPYPNLWNPATVSPELLPYLAHAKGVPDWGDDTDAAKRDTVANIWPVQGKAGTRAAVKAAVDGLGFDAEVKRGDGAYQLQVDLWREDVGTVEPDIVARARRRIDYAKSERDSLGITLSASADGWLRVALSSAATVTASGGAALDGSERSAIGLGVALGAGALISVVSYGAAEKIETGLACGVALASGARLLACSAPAVEPVISDVLAAVALASGCKITQTVTECY